MKSVLPIYPGVYVAYNTGKLSFSAGFNPVGGGGGATYDNGLPSFEMGIADIVPGLSGAGIPTTQYSADIFFKGSSIYLGYQANIGYKINDMISVAAGVRIVSAKNTYNGYIKNISINPNYPAFGAAYTRRNGFGNPILYRWSDILNWCFNSACRYSNCITANNYRWWR